jgi:hypothetical protein
LDMACPQAVEARKINAAGKKLFPQRTRRSRRGN